MSRVIKRDIACPCKKEKWRLFTSWRLHVRFWMEVREVRRGGPRYSDFLLHRRYSRYSKKKGKWKEGKLGDAVEGM